MAISGFVCFLNEPTFLYPSTSYISHSLKVKLLTIYLLQSNKHLILERSPESTATMRSNASLEGAQPSYYLEFFK